MKLLNRVVGWHTWGLSYEADPRHAEIIIRELKLTEKDAVVTPGVKPRAEVYQDPEMMKPLEEEEAAGTGHWQPEPIIWRLTAQILPLPSKSCAAI